MSKNADQLAAAHSIDGKKDAADHLGLNYKSYVDKVYALALKNPTTYYESRDKTKQLLIKKLITDSFDTIFDLLRYGQIGDEMVTPSDYVPSYTTVKCQNYGMDVAKTFEIEIVDKVLEILFPADFQSLAKNSMIAKAATNSIS